MVKTRVISLTLLAPLLLASTAANAGTSPRQTTMAKPASTSAADRNPMRKTARSKERIYTYKPAATEPQPSAATRPATVRVKDSSPIPFVGFSPVDNSVMGVGLWRMPKTDSLDPNRGQPLRDMKGKTGKAAAVGFQLNF